MADSLSLTSRFNSILLGWGDLANLPGGIFAVDSDGDRHYVSGIALGNYVGDWLANVVPGSDIDILQTIYASEDGFRDGDGNAVIVTLNSAPPELVTLADIDAHGLLNPFDSDSYDRWIARQQMVALLREGLDEDSTPPGWRTNFPLTVEEITVDDAVTVNLLDSFSLSMGTGTTDRFQFARTYPLAERVTFADILADVRVKALLQWLETQRQTGDPIDLSAVASTTQLFLQLTARTFQDVEGTYTLDFGNYSGGAVQEDVEGTDYFISFSLTFRYTGTGDLHLSDVRDLLRERDIVVPLGTSSVVRPEWALKGAPAGQRQACGRRPDRLDPGRGPERRAAHHQAHGEVRRQLSLG